MAEKPLYEDIQLKIDYNPRSSEEHIVFMRKANEDWFPLAIQRGILEEMAETPIGGIERKIQVFNDMILYHLKNNGLSVDKFHIAVCQAQMAHNRELYKFQLDIARQ